MARLQPLSTLAALLRHPSVSRAELEAWRDQRLARVVRHAYERVPYYRRLFDAHRVDPRSVRTAADLEALPVTRRRDLQELPARELVASGIDPERLVAHTTSGSSGKPFTVRRAWVEERVVNAFRRRAMAALGVGRRDRLAVLSRGHPHRSRAGALGLRALQSAGLYPRRVVSCLLPAPEIVAALRAFRPDVVRGYAGALAEVARELGPAGDPRIRPRLVVAGAEVLTPGMRARIGEAFHAPVYDVYGCHEFNLVAWECPAGGRMHTCDDSLVLEVLQDGRATGPGERGELVGTALHSYAMPFLRYAIGDVVTRGEQPCPCGVPFGTLREVQGRMLDYLTLPDGRRVHAYDVSLRFRDRCPWIQRFQIVQERRDRVVIRVVVRGSALPDARETVRTLAAPSLGPGVELDVELVPAIAPDASGKFRVCRSELASEYEPRADGARSAG